MRIRMRGDDELGDFGSRSVRCIVFAQLGFAVGSCLAADDPIGSPKRIPIGMAYAGTAVNTDVFRVSSLVTAGGHQFATYYDPSGSVVVAARADRRAEVGFGDALSAKGNVKDAHNDVVLGVSSDGLLHLSYDHHNQKLHYRVSGKPFDVHSFGNEQSMTGKAEGSVTYPQFVSAPDGTLYFFYRDGASGNGSLCINRYAAAVKHWEIVAQPLIDGQNISNPYWWRPAIASDGARFIWPGAGL